MGIISNLEDGRTLKLPNRGNFEKKEIKSKWENKLDEESRKKDVEKAHNQFNNPSKKLTTVK